MSKRIILTLSLLLFALSVAWAQDSSTPPASGGTQDTSGQSQEPVPAYGQENAPPPIVENPPLSGIDVPNLEPHAAPLSYLQPGATVSEALDTNPAGNLGGESVTSVSRALGSLTLQRLWQHYDLAMDYMGGVGYYNLKGQGFKALQQFDIDQKITWKRGELNVRDSFSYLPEGNFGGSYGSMGSQGIASLGTTAFSSFWGGGALGGFGLVPRILNVSMLDISDYLSPKSAVTVAGGYAFTHFFGSDQTSGLNFIGSSQVSGQAGFSHVVSAHTQVAAVYGYQAFDFNFSGIAFHSHVAQLMYGHRVSGRMDFLIAAGPQLTIIGVPSFVCSLPNVPPGFACIIAGGINNPTVTKDNRWGEAGRARLRYQIQRNELDASYERFNTAGSGLFAGSRTDVARLSGQRPLSRVWGMMVDIGYAKNVRLEPSSAGVQANSYTYGFAGAAVHRSFGHDFHGFASYQFNELSFDNSLCASGNPCSRIANRNVVTFGVDWTPRPIRLD
jgi:hypothetical protein